MEVENGEWIMYGVDWDDPECLHSVDELVAYVNQIGFLPLFKNSVPGFSVEERTVPGYWWSENAAVDPWMWREIIAKSGELVYGKFFDKKAGFISKEWLPYFVNYRRDGYDFDALWDDEKASLRQKKIMDLFMEDNEGKEWFSYEIKQKAGFGKDGEKNFEGTITDLMMKTYLVMSDFKKRRNKKGAEYGWNIALYQTPEQKYGAKLVTKAYSESPEVSKERIINHIKEIYPIAKDKDIKKIVG